MIDGVKWLVSAVSAVIAVGLGAKLAAAEGTSAPPPPPPLPKTTVAIDAMFVLPLDKYADDADAGIGALGRYERRMGDKLSLTARGGALLHIAAVDGGSLLMLLALGGLRYDLDPNKRNGTFFSAVLGVNHVRFALDSMGVRVSDSSTSFAIDVGGGFQVRSVQIRGSIFYTPHVGASLNGDTTSYLGLSLTFGYDIVVR